MLNNIKLKLENFLIAVGKGIYHARELGDFRWYY